MISVSPETPLATAFQKMKELKEGCTYVIDGGRLVGIFTERDVLMQVAGMNVDCSRPIGEFMVSDPRTITPETSVGSALEMMLEKRFRHLPIMRPGVEGCIEGALSVNSIMVHLNHVFNSDHSEGGTRSSDRDIRNLMGAPLELLGTKTPISVFAHDTVDRALDMMRKHSIGCILVNDGTSLSGIFSERDVLMRVVCRNKDTGKTRVSDVMTRSPNQFRTTDTVGMALSRMAANSYRHTPIMKNGRVAGVISVRSILEYLLDRQGN